MVAIPQTSYTAERPAVAFAGQIADTRMAIHTDSCFAENALDAGLGVVEGTSADQVDLPANAGEVAKFRGVALYQSQREPTGNANRYAAKDPVPVLAQGAVWVQVDATNGAELTKEGSVFLVHSGAQAGKFRSDAGAGGAAATQITGARCRVAGSAGGIAQVVFNVP